MMAAIPFDTQIMVEKLEKSGVPPEQAKVQTALLAELIQATDDSMSERFSAKQDVASELSKIAFELTSLRQEMKTESAHFRQEVKTELAYFRQEVKAELSQFKLSGETLNANTKADLIRYIVSAGILQGGLIATLILKLLH
ncbi:MULTISPECIES: coiled-coil domain-containing protein [unclassified Undibacterium]|uniref:coiled-coil domain-containing protein n=1 Tax=unclassified Undibacterium TaxID=2630295 RepID=UPI002AC8F6A0|nr:MULTISPECIES: coiled-coil domain-containing protein [unclassified Undibacterium]MEB0137603.1 DUF1640 domain-containing protein [Undibacterium sp. CCC2.1]MEB0170604.1 DUF1640 domain-containing protein [Undibacterium sp. CCC1.1]MEB0174545.1 DUF1640 domain-containing protein [Undibacterium sp. CCC3.4]MEB0213658.1 DUF1640 domain-containing protein [Undibacterium sp. 5I2]WPX43824.1 DUF1640 domain-containing protein [Undibacterium sp. CCC3.4]